ncbi:MAG: tryptophan 7-halogenase [Myxococcales bacterium]|nr:tryptophan 7-halogenase [Myxococcales bacterium]
MPPSAAPGIEATRGSAPGSHYDVVVLGGGVAGMAAAITLRKHSCLSVLVADAGQPGRERIGESCPPSILLLLARLGLAERFLRGGHAPCPGFASVWGRPQVGYNDFIGDPAGPAWRLNRPAFDRMLADRARQLGADVTWGTRFAGVELAAADGQRGGGKGLAPMVPSGTSAAATPRDLPSLEWARPRCVAPGSVKSAGFFLRFGHGHQATTTCARFLLDATGPGARFARALGVSRHVDDRLLAWIRFARIAAGTLSRQVLLEATREGWWYAASLPDGRVVSMVVADKGTFSSRRGQGVGQVARALERTTFVGPALARLSLREEHHRIEAINSGLLAEAAGPTWMAIGDAASSYDPLAAQGIHKALASGMDAAREVVACAATGSPLPARAYTAGVTERYQLYRRQRAHFYALEQRWTDAPFWRNRQRVMQAPVSFRR